jgi:hypothetical protein
MGSTDGAGGIARRLPGFKVWHWARMFGVPPSRRQGAERAVPRLRIETWGTSACSWSTPILKRLKRRHNCGKFIEYLVPAFHLTAILCALHGFISDEGEFRLAVSEILEDGHIVRTLDGLMFNS